ncbi:hypothetical protein OX283_002565 [Flavobacterium sp. SUN052]|uniref:hypothetical protein n=1 Tax=Flavobacterium sp. SUN052 TaxID=3002441 RepID=UPI00237DBDB5|nr:hypothetical protein [Flavobacterium sp. SUN052]MEC4003529.1 hypothetical protein [Flavobacterium sp. SUN052]
MSTENQSNVPEEIDLGVLFGKINSFFSNILFSIFKGILFIKKNFFIFLGLLIIGFGLGFYLDSEEKYYDSDIIVSPNMGGTDYLYSKIDLLSSKLNERDTAFFKSIGVKNPNKISLIEVEPVIDIYTFVNNSTSAANAQNTQNFELVKLLAESSDINNVIKDKVTSKNYPHHKIHISTLKPTSENDLVKPILKYLNTDKYLNEILAISKDNIKIKMKKNEELISQTDSLIRILTQNLSKNQKSSNLVYNNENNQFNSFFELKNNLINEIANQRIELVNSNAIVKDISTVVNIKNNKGIHGKMKFILPFFLFFMFIIITIFISFYRKQAAKLNK